MSQIIDNHLIFVINHVGHTVVSLLYNSMLTNVYQILSIYKFKYKSITYSPFGFYKDTFTAR